MIKQMLAWFFAILGVCMVIGAFTAQKGIAYGLLCVLIGGAFCAIAFLLFKSVKDSGSTTIVKTKIVDAFGKTSVSSAATRGVVGNMVAGPVGAVVGASTAKSNRSTTFLIFYKNGKKATRTVPNNSLEYQKYIKYLDE